MLGLGAAYIRDLTVFTIFMLSNRACHPVSPKHAQIRHVPGHPLQGLSRGQVSAIHLKMADFSNELRRLDYRHGTRTRTVATIMTARATRSHSLLDPSHQSHNALDKYPTMHHFVTEMWQFCHNMVHCGIWDGCIVSIFAAGLLQQYTSSTSRLGKCFGRPSRLAGYP